MVPTPGEMGLEYWGLGLEYEGLGWSKRDRGWRTEMGMGVVGTGVGELLMMALEKGLEHRGGGTISMKAEI